MSQEHGTLSRSRGLGFRVANPDDDGLEVFASFFILSVLRLCLYREGQGYHSRCQPDDDGLEVFAG